MGWNSGTKITEYREVILSETEFKKASELDSSEYEYIRKRYIRDNVIRNLFGIAFATVVTALWFTDITTKVMEFSEVIGNVLLFVVAFSIAISAYLTARIFMSLAFFPKIYKQDFYCHVGNITRKKYLWSIKYLRKDHYYIIDDEYCSRAALNPYYRKGTEVYFLYFPGFWERSYIGGIVVKKIHD